MDANKLKNILEAGLLVAGRTLSVAQLEALFQHDTEKPSRKEIKEALVILQQDYEGRGIELVEVASGFRLQSHQSVSDWVANLFQEKPPRYSRALLETLVLIAYRQPITRAEIEDVRGVAVSSNIIKTLQERQWVKVLGHKDVPGRPALLGTTKEFLDYFNLKKLDDLPALADIKDLDQFDALLVDEAGSEGDQSDDPGDEGGDDNDKQDNGGNGQLGLNVGDTDPPAIISDSGSMDAPLIDLGAEPEDAADDSPDAANESGSGDTEGHEDGELRQALDSADAANDEEPEPDEHNETLSAPELKLLQVISDFSEEHQQEVDARDEMESRMLSGSSDEDEPDQDSIADLSQRVSDDHSGDMPEPGDTLH